MTDQERIQVSKADHECDVQKHLNALNSVLETNDCKFPSGEVWHPAEVVERCSHVQKHPAFAACTALVLINAIDDGDSRGNTSFRWENNGAVYMKLPSYSQNAIMAGYRHLYEILPDWAPFEEEPASKKFSLDESIPWLPAE